MQKLKALGHDADTSDEANSRALEEIEKQLTPEEQQILVTLKGRRMVRPEDSLNIENFLLDSIDGLGPRMERGNLGLQAAKKAEVKFTKHDPLSYLNGEWKTGKTQPNGDIQTNGVNGHIHGHMNGEPRKDGKMYPNGDALSNGVNGHINGVASFVKSSVKDLDAAQMSASHVPIDEATRHGLMSSLHQSAEDLETPFDTVVRLVDAVS